MSRRPAPSPAHRWSSPLLPSYVISSRPGTRRRSTTWAGVSHRSLSAVRRSVPPARMRASLAETVKQRDGFGKGVGTMVVEAVHRCLLARYPPDLWHS